MNEGQAGTLLDAMRVLGEIEETARAEGWEAAREGNDANAPVNFGRVCEAADVARDTLFNVLNTAASHTHDPSANAAINRYLGRNTVAA